MWQVCDSYGHARATTGAGWVIMDAYGEIKNVTYNSLYEASPYTPATPPAGYTSLYAVTNQGHTQLNQVDEDGTVLRVNRDNVLIVRNTSGSSMAKGVVVNFTGSTGTVPTVDLADADTFGLHAEGILVEGVANNGYGLMMCTGQITGLDTSAYSAGNKLYLSSTAGAFTATAPASPATLQELATVVRSHATQGTIEVQVQTAIARSLSTLLAGDYGDISVADGIVALDEDGVFDAVAPMIADSPTVQWDRDSEGSGRLVANVINPSGIFHFMPQQNLSATFYELTQIPEGVRRVSIAVSATSFGTNSELMVQVGDSSGYYSSGYSGACVQLPNAGAIAGANPTGSWRTQSAGSGNDYSGVIMLQLVDEVPSQHRWVCSGQIALGNSGQMDLFGGYVIITGPLTKIKVGSADGIAVFDGGKISFQYWY